MEQHAPTTPTHELTPNSSLLMSDEFLRLMPKTDLHCHLDGSIRMKTLIELAEAQGVKLPATTEQGLEQLVFKERYANLEEYLEGFHYTDSVLRNPEACERVAYELAMDQFADGVRYIEVRYAPQLLAIPGKFSVEDSILSVNRGFKRAADEINSRPEIHSRREPEFGYAIIVCAMRFFLPEFSPYYTTFCEVHKHEPPSRVYGLASVALMSAVVELVKRTQVPVVALDIAGPEAGYPASSHSEAFALAHKNFFHKTIHAGEGYGPESIFQAITACYADRIGHGVHLLDVDLIKEPMTGEEKHEYVEKLAEHVSHRRLCLEVCLTSNLQTSPELKDDVRNHPLRKFLDRKVAVTLCTDNMTVGRTTVSKEFRIAIDGFSLTPEEVRNLVASGFRRSFMPGSYVRKRQYVQDVLAYFDQISKQFNIRSHIHSLNSRPTFEHVIMLTDETRPMIRHKFHDRVQTRMEEETNCSICIHGESVVIRARTNKALAVGLEALRKLIGDGQHNHSNNGAHETKHEERESKKRKVAE